MGHGLPPLQIIGAALVEQDGLLSQGNRCIGNLFEACGQHIELPPLLIWLAMVWLCRLGLGRRRRACALAGQLLPLLNGGA